MNNLRSTIKLESTSGFPDKINITANSNSNIEGSINIAKKKVVNGFMFGSDNLITSQPIGRKGATFYAESPSSNNKVIALYTIQSLDNYFNQISESESGYQAITEGPSPFARLKPGDSMFQHLPFEAVGVIAILEGGLDNAINDGPFGDPVITSTQTADLNYFIGDNGTSQGSSMAYLQNAYNGSFYSYQVQIMDVDSGKKLRMVDLDIDSDSGWIVDDFIVVQNKGYGLFFRDINTSRETVVLIDKYGGTNKIVDNDDANWNDFDGRGFYVTTTSGNERTWYVFDGESTYSYTVNCSDWDLENDYDNGTVNGKMVIKAFDVDGYSGYNVTYLFSEGNAIILNERQSFLTGLINTSTDADLVTGIGTKFTTETRVGDTILDGLGSNAIGTIAFITNDTQITLVAPAAFDLVNYSAVVQTNNISNNFYVYRFGKTIVHTAYDITSDRYLSIKLWSEDGYKIRDVNLFDFQLDNFDFYFYGAGRFGIIAWDVDSLAIPWRLFVYDPLTNKLHGEDGNWTVDRALHPEYDTYNFSGRINNPDYESSINSETFVAAFYEDNGRNSYSFINQYSNHVNLEVLFPGAAEHGSFDLTVNPGIYWRRAYSSGIFPTSEYIRFHTSTGTRTTGNLIANTIIPGANTIVQTPIADLSKIANKTTEGYNQGNTDLSGNFDSSVSSNTVVSSDGDSNWLEVAAPGYGLFNANTGQIIGTIASVDSNTQLTLVEPAFATESDQPSVFSSDSKLLYLAFGEYAFYSYYKPDTNATTFVALNKAGDILDTLVVPGICTTAEFWVHQYNTFYFYKDDGQLNYYFNNASKKFIQIPYYYGNYDLPRMAYSTGVNTGNILLDDTDPWQILSPNALSPEIRIPDQYDSFSIGDFMGENYLFVTFNDDNKPDNPIIILVYDLFGNLVNTVETFYSDHDNRASYGDRMELYLINSTIGGPDAVVLVTPTSIEYTYEVGDAKYTLSNDWEWQLDYWC